MLREEKQVRFMNDHLDDIIKFARENENKIGFTEVYVTAEFKPLAKPRFVEGKFKKKDYILLESLKIKNREGKKIETYYLKILWSDNHTLWEIKQEVEVFTIQPVGLPKSESLN